MSSHILKGWEQATEQKSLATKRSLQGKNRTFSDEQIGFVVNLWKSYVKERKKVKMTAFMKQLKKNWHCQSWLTPSPSRKTVEDMLAANDCRKPKIKTAAKPKYHSPLKRYFPHAQTVLDGKQVIVSVNGNDYTFVLELCKDMASDAIGGCAIGDSETAELVKQAFEEYCANHPKPLAALVDNGAANKKAAIDMGTEGVLMIKAYPYRAETKGQIEGEFSLFEKKVSKIVIEGKTDKQQAMNILKKIAEVYLRLRNQTPRCSVCPFTPEKLSVAKVDFIEAEKAYQALTLQQQKQKQQTEQRLKVSAEFNDLVESIVKEHKLQGDILRLKKSMKWIELSTIKQAEAQFAVQSQRDNFDAGKKTMGYFYAIARNMQLDKDQQRREQAARQRYGLDQQAKQHRANIKVEFALQQDKIMLQTQPHLVILAAIECELNLPEAFRSTITIFKKQIDEAIVSILKKKTKSRQLNFLNKTYQEIMQLSRIPMITKYEMINQIKERVNKLTNYQAKVVTPI